MADNLHGVPEEDVAKFAGAQLVTTFGSRLVEARVSAGLTQEQLGKLVGVTRNQVGNWESGTNNPIGKRRLVTFWREACAKMKVRPEWLLHNDGPMREPGESAPVLRRHLLRRPRSQVGQESPPELVTTSADSDSRKAALRQLRRDLMAIAMRIEDIEGE